MTTQSKSAADFQASDAAWWELLVMHCGNEADARALRYTSLARGVPDSDLRVAYDCRAKAHEDWLASRIAVAA
jgi:hypothetical protein